jgi:hypothetical protein
MKKIFENPDILKWLIIGLGSFAAAVLVFGAGVKVGEIKARHSYRWAENYHKNFAGPRGGFMGGDWMRMPKSEFMNAHGVFGEIIKIDSSTDPVRAPVFIIRDKSNIEKVVVAAEDVSVMRYRNSIKTQDLSVGDNIVVIGEPNDLGQIEAKLIRVMPTSSESKRGGQSN